MDHINYWFIAKLPQRSNVGHSILPTFTMDDLGRATKLRLGQGLNKHNFLNTWPNGANEEFIGIYVVVQEMI